MSCCLARCCCPCWQTISLSLVSLRRRRHRNQCIANYIRWCPCLFLLSIRASISFSPNMQNTTSDWPIRVTFSFPYMTNVVFRDSLIDRQQRKKKKKKKKTNNLIGFHRFLIRQWNRRNAFFLSSHCDNVFLFSMKKKVRVMWIIRSRSSLLSVSCYMIKIVGVLVVIQPSFSLMKWPPRPIYENKRETSWGREKLLNLMERRAIIESNRSKSRQTNEYAHTHRRPTIINCQWSLFLFYSMLHHPLCFTGNKRRES
jgi:hypothetical protein